LTQEKLNGKLSNIFVAKEEDEIKDKAIKAIRKSANVLKGIMESKNLNFDIWMNAHTNIQPIKSNPVYPNDSKKCKKDSHEISFLDPEDFGRNIFMGSRTNSCLALELDSKSVFYSLADPGTKYILIKSIDPKDQQKKISGYARIFLVETNDDEIKILIDTLDGNAKYFTKAIEAEAQKLAKEIGLKTNNDVIPKIADGSHLQKIATVYPEKYYASTAHLRFQLKPSAQAKYQTIQKHPQ
jgi:hypothetical protein